MAFRNGCLALPIHEGCGDPRPGILCKAILNRTSPSRVFDGRRVVQEVYIGVGDGKAMTSDDLLSMIWDALGSDRLTTLEATDRLEDLFRYRCPDDLAKTLMKFRKAGLIKGEISMDRGGWVWWADEECRSKEV